MRKGWWLLLVAGLLSACDDEVTDFASGPQPAALQVAGWTGPVPTQGGDSLTLRWNHEPTSGDIVPPRILVVPDTVRADVAFDVTTYTVAPSGCWRAAGQKVTIAGRTLTLAPYDEHSGAALCTGALVFPAHDSRVVLSEPGEWTVRVVGRRIWPDGRPISLIVAAERTIVVR